MKTIQITIAGITPLLCNKFTDEAMMSATNGNSSALNGDKGSPREQAEEKLYIGRNKKPMIPNPNIFRCIIDAGKYFKNGKSKVTTLKSSIIPACVSILEPEIQIKHKDPWRVDTRAVRNPATGGRFATHRPMFDDWQLTFTAELDDELMAANLFREIVDAAGKRIGLGDFRPDCKGPFGKFVVTKWTEKRPARRAARKKAA